MKSPPPYGSWLHVSVAIISSLILADYLPAQDLGGGDEKDTVTPLKKVAFRDSQATKLDPKTPDQADPYKGDVDLVLGIGSQVVSQSQTNYEVLNNTALHALNLGAATPQFMTGLSFKLPWRHCLKPAGTKPGGKGCTERDKENDWMDFPWHAFVSLKFTPGSQDGINGYALGVSYRVAKYLDLLGGYTLTPLQEVSPGFQAIAVEAAKANPTAYSAFDIAKLSSNARHAFDGFPIQKIGASGNLYVGAPLTTHYTGGLIIGIAFPFSLTDRLRPSSKSEGTQEKTKH